MRDWLFEHGETYGYANSSIDLSDHLCIGIYDRSERYQIQNYIQLVIAEPGIPEHTPVGGELAPVSKTEVLWHLVQRVAVYLTVLICCVVAFKKLL